MHLATKLTRSSWAPTISLDPHQNIKLHAGVRVNVVLLTNSSVYTSTGSIPISSEDTLGVSLYPSVFGGIEWWAQASVSHIRGDVVY